jgi:hypothetical protein
MEFNMSNSNSQVETSGASSGEPASDLPSNYTELVAKRAAIEAKLEEIETVTVPAMRDRWRLEAAEIGKTPEEVVGIATKKPRGRKSKSKNDE